MYSAAVRGVIAPFALILTTVVNFTYSTSTLTIGPHVTCTNQEALDACTTSAQIAVHGCYEKLQCCSELDAWVGCMYTYCPGYAGVDGGGFAYTFTCEGTRNPFPTASGSRAASGEATHTDSDGVVSSPTGSSGGVGGGNTDSRVTPTPTSTSTGTNGSGSNSEDPAPTSTNEAGMLFAPAGALLGSFIGVLALL